ncbi:hypothetical protein BDR06DRAFT_1003858 [Suillus hirtellus]|nr:hypothetical protein BDR06DRAFT_1003858 [Suillus hirtellus]
MSTRNWICPDNVFGTKSLLDAVVSCETAPELCGPKMDHISILLKLELEIQRTPDEPCHNWCEVDWKAFNKRLTKLISTVPAQPLASEEEFQAAAKHLSDTIANTMDTCVQYLKPCPHSKCWWTKHLLDLRMHVKNLSKITYQMRGLPNHPSHDELKTTKNLYANKITTTKKQHWLEWLEDIEGNDLWTVNCYISLEP